MEFSEKLQKLRKERKLTQEQLAEQLFVSRTAISKWESDRGYPSIDSLKTISAFFSVSIDELLSGDELLEVCEKTSDTKLQYTKSMVFSCLDLMVLLMFFLPLFKEQADGVFLSVPLFRVTDIMPYMKIAYIALLAVSGIFGAVHLICTLLHCEKHSGLLNAVSACISVIVTMVFIVSQEPYAAVLVLFQLIVKGILLIHKV
ncbi:helix-turn-helix domain-containing protein [Ruminococcus sp.]|uniref:helix-turn-helix domain-containing protein n=1 Tax=Ruminococcus sp. TaxID=41978 RepID=UPI003F09EDCF